MKIICYNVSPGMASYRTPHVQPGLDEWLAEAWERMAYGGARVSDFDIRSYLHEVYLSPTP